VFLGGERLEGSLLVATGHTPTTDGLDLDKAGIAHTPHGITVDGSLRTTNRGVWAFGDCNGLYAFTHMAGYRPRCSSAAGCFASRPGSIIRSCRGRPPNELAQVGGRTRRAQQHGDGIRVLRWPFADNVARTERTTEGW
jgi:pyruvate/2-oxoglutarate dehydrogenase complex dihydrolipoamide dehydrogenase (E3) component